MGREMGSAPEALNCPVCGPLILSTMLEYFPSFSTLIRTGLHIPAQQQKPTSYHSNSSFPSTQDPRVPDPLVPYQLLLQRMIFP